jgi:hypothetical protein
LTSKAITSQGKNITMNQMLKDQFRNDSGGVAGAVVLDGSGPKAIAVQPGDVVWLSEDEQAYTANAPRREQDNPFINGTFTLISEGQNIKHARPLRPVTIAETVEIGSAPAPTTPAPEGSRPAGEEVATPDAVSVETEVAADGKTIVKKRQSPQPKE